MEGGEKETDLYFHASCFNEKVFILSGGCKMGFIFERHQTQVLVAVAAVGVQALLLDQRKPASFSMKTLAIRMELSK